MWLFGIIFFAFILLLIHCYLTRGKNYTLKIFLGGIILFVAKEIQNQFNYPVRYVAGENSLNFLHVPWAVVFGWVFALYVGWVISEGLLYRFSPKRYGKIFPTVGLASIIVFFISMTMEVTGTQMGWWTWEADSISLFRPIVLGLPLLIYMEWMRVCFTILTYVALLEFSPLRKDKLRYAHLAFAFIITMPIRGLEISQKEQWGHKWILDNPSFLIPGCIIFALIAAIMIKYRKPWTEIYLFTFSFQIYNIFIDPFTWYAGVWILLHGFGYLFYQKARFSRDWLIHEKYLAGRVKTESSSSI